MSDYPAQSSTAQNGNPTLSPTPAPTLARPQGNHPVSNYCVISPVLSRGEQPNRTGFEQLKIDGIKTIVNLRSSDSDKTMLKGLGLRYLRIPQYAFNTSDKDIARFLRVVTDSDFTPVFVHCLHGSDRTGMMVAAYRICVESWTSQRAIDEMQVFGFHGIFENIRRRVRAIDPEAMMKAVGGLPSPEYIIP